MVACPWACCGYGMHFPAFLRILNRPWIFEKRRNRIHKTARNFRSATTLPRLPSDSNSPISSLHSLQLMRWYLRSPLSLDQQLHWNKQPQSLHDLSCLLIDFFDFDHCHICFYFYLVFVSWPYGPRNFGFRAFGFSLFLLDLLDFGIFALFGLYGANA